MMLSEFDQRARRRAIDERLHTFKVAGEPMYLVRSRHTEPGAMHRVYVSQAGVDHCTCPGWQYRRSCIHAQAVARRLERERGRKRQPEEARAA